jgi:hypothetical protein
MILRNKDVLAGALFLVLAGTFAYAAVNLPMGTTLRMGPGYFPMLLSGLLVVLGATTLLKGVVTARPDRMVEPLAWSRMLIICGAGFFFVLTLDGLGFPLAVFVTVLIASAASRDFRLLPGLALAAVVTAMAWIIFAVLLGLPFQALGAWLAGA